ncbi:MAG: hypothetical protein KJO38_02565, partial [Gammaproteobacteria bacterium]|nr:hypothetical protein [Gammaproteobacteria bacterium]
MTRPAPGRYAGCTALLVVVLTTLARPAPGAEMPIVIDFDALATPGTGFQNIGPVYEEDGFILDNLNIDNELSFRSARTGNTDAYAGSTALLNNVSGGITELYRSDGEPFNLVSIDFTEIDRDRLDRGPAGPTSITVTGFLAEGGIVIETLELDGQFGFETFTLTGFTGLSTVTWKQEPSFHQFDNIATGSVPPVPVPLPLPMLVTAMLA